MSRTLNKVMLIGNVGRDPELKHTPSGIPVISFRLATSETWKDRENNIQEHTDWHTVVAWRGLAEVINKLLRKGSRVYIEGRLQTRSFEDKYGNRRHIVEILADNMLLLDQKRRFKGGQDSDDDVDDDYYNRYDSGSDYDDSDSPPRGDSDIPF
ncbi:MAG: single-stranded DNA-binding protein [Candidatus Kapaibacterium sp.]